MKMIKKQERKVISSQANHWELASSRFVNVGSAGFLLVEKHLAMLCPKYMSVA